MSDATRHPGAQTMAASIDGRLPRGESATVTRHLHECGSCRIVVAETVRFEEDETRRPRNSRRRLERAVPVMQAPALHSPKCKGDTLMEIQWRKDIDAALREAKEGGKPILLDFSAAPM